MYDLEFLPIAQQDMIDIVSYISHDLSNPTAADELAEEMIEKAEKLRDFPFRNPVYPSIRSLKYEYRKQLVKKYIMFYYVTGNLITIARVIYSRRDFDNLLT